MNKMKMSDISYDIFQITRDTIQEHYKEIVPHLFMGWKDTKYLFPSYCNFYTNVYSSTYSFTKLKRLINMPDDLDSLNSVDTASIVLIEFDYALLDKLFYIYNMESPEDFQGHSLSIGDIIKLSYTCNNINYCKYFYCDNFGWTLVNKDLVEGVG